MKHVLVVLLVSLALFLSILGVRDFTTSDALEDEILAYEVSHPGHVEVQIYGGIERVSVTSWLVVPITTDTASPIDYTVVTEILDDDYASKETRRYDLRARVRPDQLQSPGFVARLADGRELVSDPRTLDLDVGILQGQPGRLMVRALDPKQTVLLRVSHRAERGRWERTVLERGLGRAQRERIVARRSSLGFLDLPEQMRRDAVSTVQRRLTALGREGVDYKNRRLLLGSLPPTAPVQLPEAEPLEVGPERWVAFNLRNTVRLLVQGKPGRAVWLRNGANEPRLTQRLSADGSAEWTIQGQTARSVVIGADSPMSLVVRTDAEASAFVGDVERVLAGDGTLQPDLRRKRLFRLHEKEPLRCRIAPGQPWLAVAGRLLLSEPLDVGAGVVRARWLRGERVLSEAQMDLHGRRSPFERADDLAVSEARLGKLIVPKGTTHAELFGDSHAIVELSTNEPFVETSRPEPAYDVELPEGHRFRYAPFQDARRARVLPQDVDDERSLLLIAQARIEPWSPNGVAIEERVSVPARNVPRRDVWRPTTYSDRYEFPSNAAVLLSSARPWRDLFIPAVQNTLLLSFATGVPRDGDEIEFTVDEQRLLSLPLRTTTGQRRIHIPRGRHRVAFKGPREGLLLVHAAPAEFGRIVRRQKAFALARGEPVTFPFEVRQGELLTLNLLLISADGNVDVPLAYSIDGGDPKAMSDTFTRRTTEPGGSVLVRTGKDGTALIWDASRNLREEMPDRIAKLAIPLGDDLLPGAHTLTLETQADRKEPATFTPFWVRVVVSGRRMKDSL